MLPFLDLSAWKSARSGVLIPDDVFGDVVSKAKMDLERRRNEERILTELSEWPGRTHRMGRGRGNDGCYCCLSWKHVVKDSVQDSRVLRMSTMDLNICSVRFLF